MWHNCVKKTMYADQKKVCYALDSRRTKLCCKIFSEVLEVKSSLSYLALICERLTKQKCWDMLAHLLYHKNQVVMVSNISCLLHCFSNFYLSFVGWTLFSSWQVKLTRLCLVRISGIDSHTQSFSVNAKMLLFLPRWQSGPLSDSSADLQGRKTNWRVGRVCFLFLF